VASEFLFNLRERSMEFNFGPKAVFEFVFSALPVCFILLFLYLVFLQIGTIRELNTKIAAAKAMLAQRGGRIL
jgi:hypothetical protein